MSYTNQQIEDIAHIVAKVLLQNKKDLPTPLASLASDDSGKGEYGIFNDLDDAIKAASQAIHVINTLAVRDRVISAIRSTAVQHAEKLAQLAVEETGMGRVADKTRKNLLMAERTPGIEALQPLAMSGDGGLTLIENAPWGLIASVTPSTNPVATVINNAISMIAAGNAIIFSPHPGAKRVTQLTIQLLNKAIFEKTGILNLLVAVKEPSSALVQKLFKHPLVNLLVVTGGESVVNAANKHATMHIIAAGAGNPPVVVDSTANILRAAQSIYEGASFDNNIICADEKTIIVEDSVADNLIGAMKDLGAVVISNEQSLELAKTVLKEGEHGPVANPAWVGRDAKKLAAIIGCTVPDSCRLLLVDVGDDIHHPFAFAEQMMPILPVLRAKNVDEAIEWAVQLERGYRHTAGMHSTNIDNLSAMARRIDTTLFVKNGPHIAGLGAGGEGWTSMTIATPTGEGVTNAQSFVRLRRCVVAENLRII